MPTISVIIPAYNAERTILETIQSIQQQTFQDFELIVINDGSTDRTLEILNQINEPRLKVFSYNNGGLPTARNRGISNASGEFISFIDADDLWTADKLESQLMALQQNPNAGVAYSWTLNMRDEGQSVSFAQGASSTLEGNVYQDLLLGNFIGSGSNILIRRSVIEMIGEFEPTMKSFEDWDFYLRAAAKCEFVVVPKPQILYRQTSQSMSSKVDVMEKEGLRAIERAYQAAPLEIQYLRNKSLAFLYRYCAGLCLANNIDAKLLKYAQEKLWIAVKLYPPILRERYAQNLITKLLVKRVLPDSVSQLVISVLKKPFSRRDPRLH
ncbi:glycosyltransferase family 2 protein [Aerosakkonemataceae cyanobacterium BLCC-F154]|uniref:Glycosyltransferase family 2 protein n=1 Tax=Floridaenema fluviatile BLCC-F154 TaxID=3153640 RepID=A0ABV4YIK9_9CYAN